MVLTLGKVRCAPSSPCSRRRRRCAWLRAAVLLASPALRAHGAMHCQAGTGKPTLSPTTESWFRQAATWTRVSRSGVERDCRDRRPIAGLTAPALWVGLAGTLVEFVPGRG